MGKGNSPKENPEALSKVGMAQEVKHNDLLVLWVPTSALPLPLICPEKQAPSSPSDSLGQMPRDQYPRIFIAALSVIMKHIESA